MPVTLSAELIGPEHPETAAARRFVAENAVKVSRDETRPDGLRILEGRVLATDVSLLLDGDGRMLRGRCSCSYHFTADFDEDPAGTCKPCATPPMPSHRIVRRSRPGTPRSGIERDRPMNLLQRLLSWLLGSRPTFGGPGSDGASPSRRC